MVFYTEGLVVAIRISITMLATFASPVSVLRRWRRMSSQPQESALNARAHSRRVRIFWARGYFRLWTVAGRTSRHYTVGCGLAFGSE